MMVCNLVLTISIASYKEFPKAVLGDAAFQLFNLIRPQLTAVDAVLERIRFQLPKRKRFPHRFSFVIRLRAVVGGRNRVATHSAYHVLSVSAACRTRSLSCALSGLRDSAFTFSSKSRRSRI